MDQHKLAISNLRTYQPVNSPMPVNLPLTTGRSISVTGLGYVGLMIAAAFAKNEVVIGLDVSKERIEALKEGKDVNGEVSADVLLNIKLHYTENPEELKKADFHIIAVPTPLNQANEPDLKILISASEMVGKHLKKGDIVVYESSVYPGATEEVCIPVLEKASHLICGEDFAVGYSPERINPADKEHNLTNIPKLVAASDKKTVDIVASVYNCIVKAGVYKLSSIRSAEATKVVENIQRDLNIAFVNEATMILHSLNIDSSEVFAAMQTKWNCLPFKPGLVGGHCIPVNSYYLAYKAEEVGLKPSVILTGRHLNEEMPKYIVENTMKNLRSLGKDIKKAKIALFGLSYKENTPDVHDTPTKEIINALKAYETEILVYDPVADKASAKKIHGIDLCAFEDLKDLDAIIFIVAHHQFVNMDKRKLNACFKGKGLIMDIKNICDPLELAHSDIMLWKL